MGCDARIQTLTPSLGFEGGAGGGSVPSSYNLPTTTYNLLPTPYVPG
jgi:hypothetical protein